MIVTVARQPRHEALRLAVGSNSSTDYRSGAKWSIEPPTANSEPIEMQWQHGTEPASKPLHPPGKFAGFLLSAAEHDSPSVEYFRTSPTPFLPVTKHFLTIVWIFSQTFDDAVKTFQKLFYPTTTPPHYHLLPPIITHIYDSRAPLTTQGQSIARPAGRSMAF